MKIKFLGTGAFEGIPAMFCDCDVCKKARANKGKDFRTRSQALIDDKILIDFPADTMSHFLTYDIPLSKITTCLITHSHSDHFYPADFNARANNFTKRETENTLRVYSGEAAYNDLKNMCYAETVLPVLAKPFEAFEADGYTITPLLANHTPETSPYVYIIEKDGKSILYNHDSGEYNEETWEYLKNCNKKLSFVTSDCTDGDMDTPWAHMSVNDNMKLREKFIEIGIADENTIWVLNHFSHNGIGVLYEDMNKMVSSKGWLVSYDGMEVEF